MFSSYDRAWLIQQVNQADRVKYLFFWGHPKGETVSASCLSQWYESPFSLQGTTFRTAEHWMMAQKALLFNDRDIFQQIITAASPGEAKALGRAVKNFDEATWQTQRMRLVTLGNIHKFNQHRELGEFLLNTKGRVLVEASPVDKIWGIGLAKDDPAAADVHRWRGQNLLGFSLMAARDFLRTHGFFAYDFAFSPPWLTKPTLSPDDAFWQSQPEKKILEAFKLNWAKLDEHEQAVFAVSQPEPDGWEGFYPLAKK